MQASVWNSAQASFTKSNIVISDAPGSAFDQFLLFEQEGVNYEKKSNGDPILPIFRVADTNNKFEGAYPKFMENGPIWRALPAPKD